MKRKRIFSSVTIQVITEGGQSIPLSDFILSLENVIRAERQKVSRFADFVDKKGLNKEWKKFKGVD